MIIAYLSNFSNAKALLAGITALRGSNSMAMV